MAAKISHCFDDNVICIQVITKPLIQNLRSNYILYTVHSIKLTKGEKKTQD